MRPIVQTTTNSDIPAVKFLGVFVDPNLNFKYHINYLSGKISKSLFFLRSAKNLLTPKSMKALYYTLVHCHLVYALPVWSCTTSNHLNIISIKQKIAIRQISNSPYNAHTEPIFKNLGILPFTDLIQFSKLQFMQLYSEGFLPPVFNNEWIRNEERRQDQDQAILRNQDNLFIPFARTNFSERLPLTAFPKIWSDFQIHEIKIIRNKIEFKFKLKKHFLSNLSETVNCQRLLCPRCHLPP